MFISWQTFEGLKITSYSTIEVVRLLLHEGCDYVLTERFCQDVLEEYFEYQRGMGRRADNPPLKEFGYNANAIAIQGQLAPIIKGNVVGQHHQGRGRVGVMAEPLNARKSSAKRRRFDNSQYLGFPQEKAGLQTGSLPCHKVRGVLSSKVGLGQNLTLVNKNICTLIFLGVHQQ